MTLRPEGFTVHGRGSAEVDTVIDALLRELDRRADEVRVGHAALDLPSLANAAPTELPKDNNGRLLRFPIWLASLPACVELARHRLLNIAIIRYCSSGVIGLSGGAGDNKPSPIAAP